MEVDVEQVEDPISLSFWQSSAQLPIFVALYCLTSHFVWIKLISFSRLILTVYCIPSFGLSLPTCIFSDGLHPFSMYR